MYGGLGSTAAVEAVSAVLLHDERSLGGQGGHQPAAPQLLQGLAITGLTVVTGLA